MTSHAIVTMLVLVAFSGGMIGGVAICIGPKWLYMTVIILTVLICGLLAGPAGAVSWCPTKSESHRAHPRAWLYWHSAMRCWDDHRRNDRNWPLRPTKPSPAARQEPEREKPKADDMSRRAGDGVIWPAPVLVPNWLDRWPEEFRIGPATWLREANTFGRP